MMKRLFAILTSLFLILAGMLPWIVNKAAGEQADDPVGAEPVAEWIYEDPEENRKIEEAIDWRFIEGVTLTAYCPCTECCDKDDGITYTGVKAQAGQTIAVDPDVIPLGAWVEIGGNLYHAEDTGDFSGNHIDVFFDSHSEAWDFGRRDGVTVRWYE